MKSALGVVADDDGFAVGEIQRVAKADGHGNDRRGEIVQEHLVEAAPVLGLARLARHFVVVCAVVENVDILELKVVFTHDGPDAERPATVGFKIGPNVHA